MDERLAELRELQDGITASRRDALIGTVADVLVDAPGVARSHREAPEIDGIISVPDDIEVGSIVPVRIIVAEGPDLNALPLSAGTGADDGQAAPALRPSPTHRRRSAHRGCPPRHHLGRPVA